MHPQNCTSSEPTYGFLCQETNIFYAFETLVEYQTFLAWIEEQRQNQYNASATDIEVQEENQIIDYDIATNQILSIFQDPKFQHQYHEIMLEEVDF